MAFWRRIWQRDAERDLAACTALDVGTEFAKALVFDIDADGHGTVRGVGRKRQGLAHMQSGTVADIAAVVDNCAVALQEAEEMAGFRPTQVVIGIAGELVKGFTTTHSQERKKPDQPITEAELQRLIDAVQREALHEAERAITWETGLPHVDVRLVHAAVTGASIDGYALTNPVGFQGRHVKIGIFNAFAPLVHLGALQSVASQLDLELLEIVAEPYAVARVLGSDQIRQAGALFVDVGGGTTDVALVRQGGIEGTRMFALGGRAFTKSLADRLDLPFPRAEALKVDYARGAGRRPCRRARDDRGGRRSGLGGRCRARDGGAVGRRPPARADLPVRRRIAAAGDPRRARLRGLLRAAAVRPAAGGHRHGARPDRDDLRRDRPARRPAGRDAAGTGVPGDRAPDVGRCARCRAPPRAQGDEGLTWPDAIIYLEVDDEITSAAARIRDADAPRIAVVLPYGSRVATSRINFRLLSRDALTHDKRLSIVSGDAGDPGACGVGRAAGLRVGRGVRVVGSGTRPSGRRGYGRAVRRRGDEPPSGAASDRAAVRVRPGPPARTAERLQRGLTVPAPPAPTPPAARRHGPDRLPQRPVTRDAGLSPPSRHLPEPSADRAGRPRWRRRPDAVVVGAGSSPSPSSSPVVGAYLLLPSARSGHPAPDRIGPHRPEVTADPTATSADRLASSCRPSGQRSVSRSSGPSTRPGSGSRRPTPTARPVREPRPPTSPTRSRRGASWAPTSGVRFRTPARYRPEGRARGPEPSSRADSVKVTAVEAGEDGNVDPDTIVGRPGRGRPDAH